MTKKEQIIQLLQERPNMKAAEIAAEVNCSDVYVRDVCQREGIELGKAAAPQEEPVEEMEFFVEGGRVTQVKARDVDIYIHTDNGTVFMAVTNKAGKTETLVIRKGEIDVI